MGLDIDIISAAQKGKASAQETIYDLYSSAMLGVCARYCRNLADAEDVLQDGFFKAFTKMSKSRFETVPSFSAWLKRIMINTALNHIRAQKKNLFIDEWNDNLESSDMTYEDSSDSNIGISQKEILKMIQSLPDGYRTIFNLFVIEKYSHQDIAVALGISVNTSKTQLFKARKILQQKIKEQQAKKETIYLINNAL